MVERYVRDVEVASSNLVISTIKQRAGFIPALCFIDDASIRTWLLPCNNRNSQTRSFLFYLDHTVRLYGDHHTVLYVVKEFVSERINHRHGNAVHPYVRKNRACGGK